MRLREWAAQWLVGAAAFLYSLFFLSISFPTPFAEVSLAFLLQCDFWEAIPLSPFPVVSLRFAVSVLTAPVTHQALDLQKNESSSPLRPLSVLRTQKIFGSRPCPNRVSQDSWLLANPSWLTAWAVKMVMTLSRWGGTDSQSGLVVSHQPLSLVLRSSPLLS